MEKYFQKTITKKQASDTGMAMVLILLLIGLLTQNILYYKIAIPVLIMNMIFPMFYYLFAIVWLSSSKLIGALMSRVILTIIYIIMVVPVGIFRRLLGKDTLQLSDFKKDSKSVMKIRNYNFTSQDVENPY